VVNIKLAPEAVRLTLDKKEVTQGGNNEDNPGNVNPPCPLIKNTGDLRIGPKIRRVS